MTYSFKKFIAFGFGIGYIIKIAPGTFSTLLSWIIWCVILQKYIDNSKIFTLLIIGFFYGCYACSQVSKEMGMHDSSQIVWDEIVSFWLVLLFIQQDFLSQLLGFLSFRFFDIFKPFPINYFDCKLKSGFGIMFDDLLAAIFTVMLITTIKRFL